MTRKDIMKYQEQNKQVEHPRSYYERRVVPSANIVENNNEFIVHVDMPGVNKESISLKVDGDSLHIQGSTGNYHKDNAKMYLHETRPTIYEREFNLSNEIDRSKITGEYNNGVLLITLQKNEKAKPQEIKIK